MGIPENVDGKGSVPMAPFHLPEVNMFPNLLSADASPAVAVSGHQEAV